MNLAEVAVGTRVTMRYRDADGLPNEAVGHITGNADGAVTLDTRRGEVVVEVARVEAWRVVPPRTERLGRQDPHIR